MQLANLSEQKFVSLTPGFATTANSTWAFKHTGFTRYIAMELGDIFSLISMISMISASIGYALW